MQIEIGYFDKAGNPCLQIGLGGVSQNKKFEAIIDTGFTGFVSMPLIKAFPLGLPLYGTTDVTLADGTTSSKLLAHSKAIIGGEEKFGLVILEPNSNEVLLGMDFLRSFKKSLFVSKLGVVLVAESEFEKFQQQQSKQTSKKLDSDNNPSAS